MSPLSSFKTTYQNRVDFDPKNSEHVKAFELIVFQNKQHETIRFKCDPPFVDLRTMLLHKVGQEFLSLVNQ